MSTLPSTMHAMQSWMQEALAFPQSTSSQQLEQLLEPSSRLSGTQRLAIYQRSYYLRLLKCMREQFPALCHALGEELFNDFAYQYLQALPSVSYTLYELGRRFPGYLEANRPDAGQPDEQRESWVDFMVDLARYEFQLFAMFDAPGHEGKPFASVDTADNRLLLQPCFALGNYRFPVAWYYHEVRKRNDAGFPHLERSPVALVRKDYLTHTFPLSIPEYTFLLALEANQNIETALEMVAGKLELPMNQVSSSWSKPNGIRARWITAGFFITAD